MERFLGTIDAKADAKGRVAVPVAFRRILSDAAENKLVIQKNIYKDCLVLYPKTKWDEELTDLKSRLNMRDEAESNLFRSYVSFADEVEIDTNGRILIPKRYLQMANLKSEIRFLGVDFTIEVWNRETLDATLLSASDMKAAYKNLFSSKKDE
jgi:MraZ protein